MYGCWATDFAAEVKQFTASSLPEERKADAAIVLPSLWSRSLMLVGGVGQRPANHAELREAFQHQASPMSQDPSGTFRWTQMLLWHATGDKNIRQLFLVLTKTYIKRDLPH